MGRAARDRLRHGGRLDHLRPPAADARLGVRPAGRRERHVQDLGLARRRARQLQGPRRGGQRRGHAGPRPAHAARDDRDDDGAVPARRRADRRRVLFDLRVRGVLRGAVTVPAAPQDHRRAGREGPRSRPVGLVGLRLELARRDGDRARGARSPRLGPVAREEGHGQPLRQDARGLAHADRRAVVLRLLELLLVPLRQLLPRLGHVPLLHRGEVLQRDVVRPALRVRRRRRLRGSVAAPPRRAAQDHEPAHQHDDVDDRHPRASRFVQVALHARALGVVQAGHRVFPLDPRRQALGGGAGGPRLQRDARVEHPRVEAREPRAGVGRPREELPHPHRSRVHHRDVLDDVVGLRLAGPVRRARRLRDELPESLLLDGRGVPTLGLAVLLRGRRMPRAQGEDVRRRRLPRLRGAAARVPGVLPRGSRARHRAAAARSSSRASRDLGGGPSCTLGSPSPSGRCGS